MPSPADPDRLAALEQAVAELQRDVRDLRTELRGALAAPPAAPRPPLGERPLGDGQLTGGPLGPGVAPAPFPRRPSIGARAAAYARTQAAGLGLPTPTGAGAPDVEALVGRYATVAVAALLILTAVGAAVSRFTITPAARVALGVVLSVVMAAGGWRLRTLRRPPGALLDEAADTPAAAGRAGARRFGDVLLALALAVTHVNAWAAGPYLGLVPPTAALVVAALASIALAALAWRARQQALFVVGVGGALVAPFVTGSTTGRPLALAAYGWVVLAAGVLALPGDATMARKWRAAARILASAGALYTVVLLDDVLGGHTFGPRTADDVRSWGTLAPWRPTLPAIFALAAAAVPLGVATRRRSGDDAAVRTMLGGLALAFCTTTAGALLTLGAAAGPTDLRLGTLAVVGTLATYLAIAALDHGDISAPDRRLWIVGALLRGTTVTAALTLPLALLGAALLALHDVESWTGAGLAALWASLAAAAAWPTIARGRRTGPVVRDHVASAHLAVAGLASALALVLALPGHDVLRVTILAAHAAAATQLLTVVRRPLTLLAPAAVASAAAVWAAILLTDRPTYAYTPFLTPESLAAGAVTAAWYVVARRMWIDGAELFSRTDRRLAVAAATTVALLWGRQEFAEAVSPDVSTFLLIGYFAVTGLGAIALGRARAVPAARQVGLALALYAALKAFLQTSSLDSVGLRVGSYLLVGGFLLAVGYWYRAAGTPAGDATPPAPPPPTPNPGAA